MNAPLPEFYDGQLEGDNWRMTCKTCGQQWTVPAVNIEPGYLIPLLFHSQSHVDEFCDGRR